MEGPLQSTQATSSTALYLPRKGAPYTVEIDLPSYVTKARSDGESPSQPARLSLSSSSPFQIASSAKTLSQPFVLPDSSSSYIPGPGESLVRVSYSGINPSDLKHHSYGVFDTILGYDFSGTVVVTCPGSPFRIGDHVGGTAPAGIVSYNVGDGEVGEDGEGREGREGRRKEAHAAHQDWVVGVDDLMWLVGSSENEAEYRKTREEKIDEQNQQIMSMAEAAGIGIPLRTATVALYADLGLPLPWEQTAGNGGYEGGVLIWGAGSQVGGWAVQLATASGIRPIYAVANSRHHNKLKEFGATRCFEYDSATGGGEEAVRNIVTAAREDRAMLKRAFDAVGFGRAASTPSHGTRTAHMADHCTSVLRSLKSTAQTGTTSFQVASVFAGGPPDTVIVHAMPDRDVEFDIQDRGKVLLERDEDRAELVLLVIEWVVHNYGRLLKVPGKVKIVGWDSAADEIVRIGEGKGEGGEKVIVRHQR